MNITSLEKVISTSSTQSGSIDPWRLFKVSEIIIAVNLYKSISETLSRFGVLIHEMHAITDAEKKTLLILCDNQVPYEFRKIWSGPKMASEYLKSVSVRIQKTFSYVNGLEDPINEANFSEIFNVDSLLSTVKLVTSRFVFSLN
jgi:dynein heavy chain 2